MRTVARVLRGPPRTSRSRPGDLVDAGRSAPRIALRPDLVVRPRTEGDQLAGVLIAVAAGRCAVDRDSLSGSPRGNCAVLRRWLWVTAVPTAAVHIRATLDVYDPSVQSVAVPPGSRPAQQQPEVPMNRCTPLRAQSGPPAVPISRQPPTAPYQSPLPSTVRRASQLWSILYDGLPSSDRRWVLDTIARYHQA
jgi:hypothetical protein